MRETINTYQNLIQAGGDNLDRKEALRSWKMAIKLQEFSSKPTEKPDNTENTPD